MAEKDKTVADPAGKPSDEEKKRLKEEKKKLKEEMKKLKAEAREQSKLQTEEEEEESGGGFSVVLVTILIVLIWLGILGLLVKLDVGGFGSDVLRPILKDVPVINKILPAAGEGEGEEGDGGEEGSGEYAGYKSIKEAVEQIKKLELELEEAKKGSTATDEQVAELNAEIVRLRTFEDNQVEFEKLKNQFYEEVVFSENAPGPEEYKKYYESIDPANAEALYKQVVQQLQEDSEIQEYAKTYSAMKPKAAAQIFENMTDNLELAARILNTMNADSRGAVMGAMDPAVAAMLTKIMDPES